MLLAKPIDFSHYLVFFMCVQILKESLVNKILVTDALRKWFSKILVSEELPLPQPVTCVWASWDKGRAIFSNLFK